MTEKFLDSLDHIQIPVNDVEQSIDWYTKNLGFYLHGRPNHDEMAFLCLEKDHTADTRPLFLLWQTNEDKGLYFSKQTSKMPVLCFKTKDIQSLKTKLIDIGADIASFSDEGWAYCMDFYDINGNLINVSEYKTWE